MKIGVALSGCDIGGVSAWGVLKELAGLSLEPAFISASGLAAVGALLYSCGFDAPEAGRLRDAFLEDCETWDLGSALEKLSDRLPPSRLAEIRGLAINAVQLADGKIVTFTNDFRFHTDTLRTYPLEDAYEILCAAAGLPGHGQTGGKLGDFSARHGHPLFPLRMFGPQRALSFSFLPLSPQSCRDALLCQKLESPSGADLHIPLHFPTPVPHLTATELDQIAIFSVQNCKKQILYALTLPAPTPADIARISGGAASQNTEDVS